MKRRYLCGESDITHHLLLQQFLHHNMYCLSMYLSHNLQDTLRQRNTLYRHRVMVHLFSIYEFFCWNIWREEILTKLSDISFTARSLFCSVVDPDPDPVGSGTFWRIRIRIRNKSFRIRIPNPDPELIWYLTTLLNSNIFSTKCTIKTVNWLRFLIFFVNVPIRTKF